MIRSFHNADVPALADVWIRHWSMIAPPPPVTVAMIEQAILSRTFFDASQLLIAEEDGRACGWCHFAIDPSADRLGVLCAICLVPEADPSIGRQLLAESMQRLASLGIDRVNAGLLRDDRFGYAGLEPIGHGIGIPQADGRITELLSQSGFTSAQSAVQMVASTGAYRPPISREAVQLRRSTQLACETATVPDPPSASAMAHFDIERYRLIDRAGKPLATVDLWCSDPEAEVMVSRHAILDIEPALQRGSLDAAESFLVASILQSLAARHVFSVESVIDGTQTELYQQLQTLHFHEQQRGDVWTRDLD